MEIKQYTDERYIALNDLVSFGTDVINETKEYRRSYMELVPLNDLDFVNIVETPALIKKRFSKNVELKGVLDFEVDNNDFILELALMIVKNNELKGLSKQEIQTILDKYKSNGNDLTIITNYLTNNVDKLIITTDVDDIGKLFPSLTKGDVEFIKKSNNINLNYSLSDYQEIKGCSYETARQALVRLSELKLYVKAKVGKKFVYKPTSKISEIMKGENHGN